MRGLRWIGRVLLAVVIGYAAAALAGGAIPANNGWVQAGQGVRIYVADNGVHTDLVLPATDFADLLEPDALGDPAAASLSHVMLGWGNRDFYLNTPTWADVNPLTVLAAMAGRGETVVHVHHVEEPRAGPDVRALVLRPDEYARLVAYLRGSFAGGAAVRGYGPGDAFYPATGGYSAVRTCNEWTGRGLRAAGVRMGVWTPFTFGVMQWL